MSQFSYNGVVLPYVTVDDFREDPIRDDQGDTDWCKTKIEIKLHTTINIDYLSVIAPDLAGVATNPADIVYLLRKRLLEHRKLISLTFEGVEMIPRRAEVNGTVDADNGPKPQSCVFFQLTNTTFLMSYHIVAHYWEAHGNNDRPLGSNFAGGNVLFNRWSESNEIDSCNYVRRVRQGKYIIRSDNVDGAIADDLRSRMAVVSVPVSFLRVGAHYTVTPDGLGIQYRVEDQEQFRMPPAPAFEARGEYREFGTYQLANRYGICRVWLKGDALTSQAALLQTASDIAIQYIGNREKVMGSSWNIIEEAGASFQFYSNEVEFWVRVRTTKSPETTKLTAVTAQSVTSVGANKLFSKNPIALFAGISTVVPYSTDNSYTPAYLDRGTAGFLLIAAAYYDPSLRGTQLAVPNRAFVDDIRTTVGNDQVQLSRGAQPGTAGAAPE